MVGGVYKYMGEVSRLVNQGATFMLADLAEKKGTELVLNLTVQGTTATASCYLKADPTKTTGDMVADLAKITNQSAIQYSQYYDHGSIGIYAGALSATTFTNYISSFRVQTEAGALTGLDSLSSYDLYSTDPANSFVVEKAFVSGTTGSKKAVSSDTEMADFTASFETELDPNGCVASRSAVSSLRGGQRRQQFKRLFFADTSKLSCKFHLTN